MLKSSASRIVEASFAAPRMTLCLAVLALTLLGLITVFTTSYVDALNFDQAAAAIASAGVESTYSADNLLDAVVKQGLLAVGGIVLAVGAHLVPRHWWRNALPIIAMAVVIAFILFLALGGTKILGATRTIKIGGFSLQPTEFCKIAFVLMAGKIVADYREGSTSTKAAIAYALILLIVLLWGIFRVQSDLGGTMIIAVGCLAVMWLAEVPLRWFVIMIACVAVFGFLSTFLIEYRSDRMLYLDPWNDGSAGSGGGMQSIRACYALAGGGLLGAGLGNSHEKFDWLSEAETDLAFAILGEEMGLVGATAVILLFLVLLVAGLHISRSCDDVFAKVVSGGLIAMLVFQAFLNICCCTGVMPITGKPLPFFSKGGSSLVASLLIIGIVLSLSRGTSEPQRRRSNFRVIRSESSPSLSPDDFHAVGSGGGRGAYSSRSWRSESRGESARLRSDRGASARSGASRRAGPQAGRAGSFGGSSRRRE